MELEFPLDHYSYSEFQNRRTISRFEIVGENRWDDPIPVVDAFVRSDVTNEKINMFAHIGKRKGDGYEWGERDVIPAHAPFLLDGAFDPVPNRMREISDKELKERFGQFSFFFNSKLVRRFYPRDVDKLVGKMFEDGAKKQDCSGVKLTLFAWMNPFVRRDALRFGQLDHVDGWRVAPFAA